MATLVYWAGVVLAVIGCLDILKSNQPLILKVLFCVALLATSWIGLLIHFLYGKKHL